MSNQRMENLVILGSVLGWGLILALGLVLLPREFSAVVFLTVSAAYLIGGLAMVRTVLNYDQWELYHFGKKYGWRLPFSMGLGAPGVLVYIFVRMFFDSE